VLSEYNDVFGWNVDPITQEKLIKYRDTKAYNDFFEHTISSMKQSREDTIVFAGLCQDHGRESMEIWMPRIRKIGGYFKDYRVIIVENDSNDDTREYLIKEAEKDNRIIVLCDEEKPENSRTCQLNIRSIKNVNDKETTLATRVGILGRFRQVYWNYIQQKYQDCDYMCVLDWDLDGNLSVPGFFHGLHYTRHHTEVVACNSFYEKIKGLFLIYDTYPLLNHHRCDNLRKNKNYEDSMANVRMRNKIFYESAYPLPVESAFGGIAIYNIQKIKEKDPNYNERKCPVECEHSTFHKDLEVYIDPWMTFLITKNRH
jgi:glycosyltransferase involved in cell wall biosynthesis